VWKIFSRVTILLEPMKTYALVVALVVFSVALAAQQPTPTGTPKAASHPAPGTSETMGSSGSTAPSVGLSDQEKVVELTHRVQMLELQVAQRPAKSESDYNVAIIGAAAVFGAALVAAVLGIFSQVLAARHAARLARDEALYKDAAKILELRMRQVQEFYAPMFALLRQSKDLYDKMLQQLVADEPSRYRSVPTAVEKEFRWEVLDKKGEWQGFRLLDQLPAIKSNLKALALVDANLLIGEKICKVISNRAGYASEALVDMLGQYMAHYAILATIRNGKETEAFEPGWHKVGYFPFGLDTKIGEAYHEVSKSIDDFRKGSTRTLETLAK
jgi:hypothetical protein